MTHEADVIVIGAGIAGVSIAASLAVKGQRVLVLEQEAHAGYHATGRSAAVFSEVYGSFEIRALSRASRSFLYSPPPGFCQAPLIRPRGLLFVARHDQIAFLQKLLRKPDIASVTNWFEQCEVLGCSPMLRKDYVAAGAYVSDAADIDVHLLLMGYVRTIRQFGGQIVPKTQVTSLCRHNGKWLAKTPLCAFRAPVIVNAAGAWATMVARMAGALPIEIEPRRRTAVLVSGPEGVDITNWPLVIDIEEQFYFKPDAGLLLLSPADETPLEPQDAQADEWDVAVAVDRIERATTLEVRTVKRRWAGLRSFTADRNPVVGFDTSAPGFFWLAGQGGYGVQTAPALARLAALLIVGESSTNDLELSDQFLERLSPLRFANS